MSTPEYMRVVGMNYAYKHMLSTRDYGGGNCPDTRYSWQSFRLEAKI